MGLRTMWFSAVAVVLGAIIWRILTEQITGVDLDILALLFMLVGAVGLGISAVRCTVTYFRGPRGTSRAFFPSPRDVSPTVTPAINETRDVSVERREATPLHLTSN